MCAQDVLNSTRYPDIHFLPIDRPALLRPDAVSAVDTLLLSTSARLIAFLCVCDGQHSAGDCLHIMTGAGVLEGWTHYIWHYITRELPGR